MIVFSVGYRWLLFGIFCLTFLDHSLLCSCEGKSKSARKSIQIHSKLIYRSPLNIDRCLGKYYQLANRLATAAFLKNNGINARCLYIYFINGYEKPNDIKNATVEMYVDEINKEKAVLGLEGESLEDLLFHVFIDAKSRDFNYLSKSLIKKLCYSFR